jgi:soluble lytic murein transglycosylase
LIAEYPESEVLDKAWQAKADILSEMGSIEEAISAYEQLAALFPESELSPEALVSAARLRQSQGDFEDAVRLYQDAHILFPDYENGDAVLWYAGLAHYRAGDPDGAAGAWRTLLNDHPDSIYAPKTLYWLDKLGAEPREPGEAAYADQLLETYSDHYYSLRLTQLSSGESLTSTRLITTAVEPPAWQPEEYDAGLLDWLEGWTEVPEDTQTLVLPESITSNPNLYRAQVLQEIGLRREAIALYEGLREEAKEDPLALAALARYFYERGLYSLAASSAAELAALSPEGQLSQAPVPLQRLAYPLPYANLLSREAAARDLDPLLLAALVRQESLFEPAALSVAGAQGLAQVMPATGAGIARSLGLTDYDLNDPATSLRFGAYYLASQLYYFEDELLVALAAYNGGPGNTLAWLDWGAGDLDLFVEVIGAVQSRLYLQGVYQQYLTYERLYR